MGDNKEVIFLGTYQPGRKFGWLDFSTSLENAYSELSDMFTFPYYSDKSFFRSNIKRQKYHLFRIGNSTITHYMGTSNKIGKEVLLEKISGTKYAFIAHTHDMKVCKMDSSEKQLFNYMKNHIAKEECMFYRVCLNPEITNPNSVPDMIDFALGEANNHLLDFPKDDPEAFYDECMKYAIAEGDNVEKGIAEKLGIEKSWMERFPGELSGGEMQRFCIARVLGERTKFILADEITTMMDPISRSQIWNFLIEETQKRDIGLIAVSHNRPLLDKICTRQIDLTEITK